MAKINMNTEDYLNVAQQLKEASGNYTELYTRLLNEAKSMGDAYNAPDNLVFVEQINGFCDDLKAMADKLIQMSEIINKERQNMLDRSDMNATQARKLTN